MLYIIIAQAGVYIFDYLFAPRGIVISDWLYFNLYDIFAGQVWRVITFVFVPPNMNPLFMLFFMSLYYMIGQSLESEWGGFYFNAFYFLGVILSIIGGFIIGYATIEYINLSLFLAFAILYPNTPLRLFMILPIKIKYLAIFDLVMLAISFIFGNWGVRLAIIISLLNVAIFFWDDYFPKLQNKWRFRHIRSKWKRG
jgi:hypothetical protein